MNTGKDGKKYSRECRWLFKHCTIKVAAHPKQLEQIMCVNAQGLCVQLQVYQNCAHTTCACGLGRSTQILQAIFCKQTNKPCTPLLAERANSDQDQLKMGR